MELNNFVIKWNNLELLSEAKSKIDDIYLRQHYGIISCKRAFYEMDILKKNIMERSL
jgi:hypothetical protein